MAIPYNLCKLICLQNILQELTFGAQKVSWKWAVNKTAHQRRVSMQHTLWMYTNKYSLCMFSVSTSIFTAEKTERGRMIHIQWGIHYLFSTPHKHAMHMPQHTKLRWRKDSDIGTHTTIAKLLLSASYNNVLPLSFFLTGSGKSTILIASSKISLSPTCVSAEHSL